MVHCTLVLLVCALSAGASHAGNEYRFKGSISRPVLENYLSRSMTMLDLLTGRGDPDDNIRMMQHCGVKFAGRAIYLWAGESKLEEKLTQAGAIALKVRQADPDIILQACIFEIVSPQVETIPIPEYVFKAFDLPVEQRNFDYEAMLFPDGTYVGHWSYHKASVPDMTRLETRMWFYYLAARYIEVGCEAIHFGQVALIGHSDQGYVHWWDMLSRVRKHAAKHARRGMVLCDAHTPDKGPRYKGNRLLFDFHSFPLRIEEVKEQPEKGVLKMGHYDSLYGRSNGGITPSGWQCEHLPYLVELDNFGSSGREGKIWGDHWIWGYDEIGWFAHQTEAYRNTWLEYAWNWVRENDPHGYLQMPGSRCVAYPVVKPDGRKLDWYYAHAASAATPDGYNQEETIRQLWLKDAQSRMVKTQE
jgi:hypothetical protein